MFGIKRLQTPLSKEQSFRLRQISDMLTVKLSPLSGNYQNIFGLDQDMEADLKELKPPGLKIRKYRKVEKGMEFTRDDQKSKTKIKKGKDEFDFDPESEGDEDDGNYVDMVRIALKDSRRILGQITPGSALWEQI